MNFQIKQFKELNVGEMYDILRMRNEVFVLEQESIYQDCDEKKIEEHFICLVERMVRLLLIYAF